jgi:8-oxo-dGTP diphosphatase
VTVRSIEAYVRIRSGGRTLRCPVGDRLLLPGGPLAQGEEPAAAVVRLAAGQTGLAVVVDELVDVFAAVEDGTHHDRLVFTGTVVGGDPERAVWVPEDGVSGRDAAAPHGPLPARAGVQRFGAYGLVRDPGGRVLLTLIAAGYPGAGSWHLPGGGTDYGEQPRDALVRELAEETAQDGRITALLGTSSGHHPAALGPEGVPVDWHTVRVHFDVFVPSPRTPRVMESPGGSTERAAWFTHGELSGARLSEVAASLVTDLSS